MKNNIKRIENFEKLGFGLFVHFGLYSILGKGEWVKEAHGIPDKEYEPLIHKFKVKADWAKNLVSLAKNSGAKYIVLTTRHLDGFSLYDTKGLNTYDAPHSASKRDLVREFVDECNINGISPFFYHTLVDWYYEPKCASFSDYLIYLRKSIEVLCTSYGKIGGLWLDGLCGHPNENWEEDALYSLIRKHQPDTMIINNTGLIERGKQGHPELDSVTFERGRIVETNAQGKRCASEMCQVLNQHWGYAENDINYKPVKELIEDLCVCRKYRGNYLLNVGPKADGSVKLLDAAMLDEIGKWLRFNRRAIYNPKPYLNIEGKKDFILKEGKIYYCFLHDIPMTADINVALKGSFNEVFTAEINGEIKSIIWLDSKEKAEYKTTNNGVAIKKKAFAYGTDLIVRVLKIETK